MEGTQPSPPSAPKPRRLPRGGWPFLILAVIVVVVALIVIPATLPRTPTVPATGGPIGFGTSAAAISGNQSSGWTYSFPVYVARSLEYPSPIVWGDLNVRLINSTNGTRLSFPAATTLRALSPANATVAEYDSTEGLWRSGFFALVEEGQTLVLHGMIPMGTYLENGTVGYIWETSLCIGYANGGQSWTDYVALVLG